MIKAFIIHLERANEREAQLANLATALPVPSDIITAIDGQGLNPERIAQYYRRHLHKPTYPFALSRNEIACFLSHRKAWKAIIEQNCASGLILEDDASIGVDFAEAFALASQFMTADNFIRLPHRNRERGRVLAEKGNACLIQPDVVGLGQVAYLVSREAAGALLEATKIFDRPVDVLLQMFWLTKIRPLSILPSGISEISGQIGGSTLHQKRMMGEKARRELLRPLYRWRIAQISKKYNEVKR